MIQSGGEYDLKPSAVSNDKYLRSGVILCSIGLRYASYCANIARTYLINTHELQDKYYDFLVSLQQKVLASTTDGVEAREVFNKALGQVRAKFPDLEHHFVRNVGHGIGIEFRDSSMVLNAKNARTLKTGMTLTIIVGFNNIENKQSKDPSNKTYSLLLIDTVCVTKGAPQIYTESNKDRKSISWVYESEGDDDEKPAEKLKRKPEKSTARSSSAPKAKTRAEAKEDDSTEQRRLFHQHELAKTKQEDGLRKYPEGEDKTNGVERIIKRFESYKRDNMLPTSVTDLNIHIDFRHQSVIVPIFGKAVPFHINTLKSFSKNDEGEHVYLRLNFVTPGQGYSKKDELLTEDASANFVRSLTYRSTDAYRFNELFREIQDMKKNATKKEVERKEMADVVEQDSLIEIRNRRPLRLSDVRSRPIIEGKSVAGELYIHQNGLRFQSPLKADHRIDIVFNNIKHLFFQPCDKELMVILHVHLHSPIMIGKRKAKDVQFYREASEAAFDETGNKKRKYRYGDEDELEQEQDERRRRAALNKEFLAFSQKISEAVGIY